LGIRQPQNLRKQSQDSFVVDPTGTLASGVDAAAILPDRIVDPNLAAIALVFG
jgi:hypothetical protein